MNRKEYYLNQLHSDILLVMDEIDRVCKKNHLRYYLIGGTLLGAIRHKGFIPWDDDLDIVMPREDMEKLVDIASKELNSNFHLEWITTNKNYWCIFSKICMNNTIFDEGKMKNIEPMGIFVDIFPLDSTGGYFPELEKIKRKLQRYHYISSVRNMKVNSFKTFLYRVASLFISNKKCYELQRSVCMSANKTGDGFYTNFGSQYSVKRQTMPKSWFGEGTLLQFEDRTYCVPEEYHKVVSSIFGPNYMQIPPENKRRTHYPRKVKFSSGETLVFDAPQHRVTLKEQLDL